MSDNLPVVNDSILEGIVEAKQRGRSWAQIGKPLGLDAGQVQGLYERAIEQQPRLSTEVYKQTQLNRLESYLDMLHDLVFRQKDVRAVEQGLAVIKEISELAELKQKQAAMVINIVDQRQVQEVTVFVEATTEALRRRIVAENPALTDMVRDNWDQWVAEAIEPPRKRLAEATEVIDL